MAEPHMQPPAKKSTNGKKMSSNTLTADNLNLLSRWGKP